MMVINTVRKIIIKLEKDTYFADSTETTIKLIKGERRECVANTLVPKEKQLTFHHFKFKIKDKISTHMYNVSTKMF